MMIRPAAFDYNSQTAASNRMQQAGEAVVDASALALAEFDAAVDAVAVERRLDIIRAERGHRADR